MIGHAMHKTSAPSPKAAPNGISIMFPLAVLGISSKRP